MLSRRFGRGCFHEQPYLAYWVPLARDPFSFQELLLFILIIGSFGYRNYVLVYVTFKIVGEL